MRTIRAVAGSILWLAVGWSQLWTNPSAAATQSSITLNSSSNPSVFGAGVTLTATVSPSTASGKVTFYDGTTILGTETLGSGRASIYTSLLASGTRMLRAYYAGDTGNAASVSTTLTQTVSALPSNGFHAPVMYAVSGGSLAVAIGDFNGDGKADFAVAGNDSVSILLGNGDGTFQHPVNYAIPSGAASIAVGDFNGDGKTDLAVGLTGNLGILLGNGDGTFQPVVTYGVAANPNSLTVADFNGDGKADLVVGAACGNLCSTTGEVLLGNGDGTFQLQGAYSIGQSSSVVAGDFNGDGKTDLALTYVIFNANGGYLPIGFITISLGNGDGTFRTPDAPVTNLTGMLAVGDFNGDGKADLAVVGNDNVSILLGNGDGTFQHPVNYAIPSGAASIAVGDFNGDGKPDLAVTGGTVVNILSGNGDGTFQTAVSYDIGASATSVSVGEFNEDGKTDLAFTMTSGITILLGGGAAPAPDLTIAKSHNGPFSQGPYGGTYTITVSNIGNAPTSGTVTVTDLLPTGLTATAIGGVGWACLIGTSTCTRIDALAAAASYPAITLTVSVAAGTPASVTNVATVSGGGETNIANDTASDPTQIQINPVLVAQTITFGPLNDQVLGTSPFSISATATSGLAVSFTSNTNAVCTVSGTTVTLVATGVCSITATQNGNAIYAVATPVTQSFTVGVVSVSPSLLTFAYQSGGNQPQAQTLMVSGAGAALAFTATPSSSGWLTVSPTCTTALPCTTPNTGTFNLAVTANPTGLNVGTSNGTITIAGTGQAKGTTIVNVTFAITAPVPAITKVTNAASYAMGAVSPGELISIFANASNPIGPTPYVQLSSANCPAPCTNVPTIMGGVQVEFLPQGMFAPLTYVSATQINCVVPYEVQTAGSSVSVEVKYLGQASIPFVLQTAATAPGIISLNGTGTGTAAMNQYDTRGNYQGINSGSNPASPGWVLVLYVTGEGSVPSPVTGSVTSTTTVKPLSGSPTVLIDQLPATVQYYGEAYGIVSGVMQINVLIPTGIRTSQADTILLMIGGNTSQNGVTVSVQ